MGMLDYGRDHTDEIIREIGTEWWEKARKATPALLEKAVAAQATAHQVDEDYLMWTLLHHRKSWSRLPNSGLLRAARRLYLDAVNRSHDRLRYQLPEDMDGERRVNRALAALVSWADNAYKDAMSGLVVSIMRKKEADIQASVLENQGMDLSRQQVRMVMFVELPLRVGDHPHWFRDPTALRLLVKGVFG